ncbi:Adenine phosphoribosyltransferase [[Mycoplasma] cavipharyngis]|uniref:adenine phosphoribosyltransferase n=1 Tax=[Mycoplasma] cavipharyngis TaxID=92757 RepID=UPI003704262B
MDQKYLKEIYHQIVNVDNFPIKGINFKDITPLFLKPELVNKIIDELVVFAIDMKADVILAPESRGFLFGLPTALKANLPFVLARKPEKLPRETVSEPCVLEYAKTAFHVHQDAILPNQRVLIIDDLLATGGTTNCLAKLIKKLGGILIGSAFCVEIKALNGRANASTPVFAVVSY